ncbi:uncharacterized protein LOC132309517 [Cornus florida]|uniref:uncharacterized protein LOC132309517 n=1 Tax=Cornus florida TaxID=4283 RepID=UPI00289A2C0A|nr:uncharacterized protein LOC132309517 [Cornus florida]
MGVGSKMDQKWYELKPRRVPMRVWLGFQKSMGVLVGGNHTSSRFCTRQTLDLLIERPKSNCTAREKIDTLKMDFKVLKWQIFRVSLVRRLLLKTFLFALAMAIIPFIQIVSDIRMIDPLAMNFNECQLNFGSTMHLNFTGFLKPNSGFEIPLLAPIIVRSCKRSDNLTINVFKELMKKDFLDSDAKALCIGEGSASAVLALEEFGFSNAFGVERHPFFSLLRKRFVYELDFKDNYFDFVFSRALDKVSVPALLVHEIERVLRPGGTGAMLVGANSFYSGALIRSAIPVSSFLRNSNVVHVCGIGSFALIVFKKRFDTVASFEHSRLPSKCPSVLNNKPIIKYMEPLVDKKSEQLGTQLSYLPKFMNMSSRNRLIYINVGAGEFVNSSIEKMFMPHYPIQSQAFDVYVVDHDPSVLLSYVKEPGVTFVYHPGLAKDMLTTSSKSGEDFIAPLDDEKFDLIRWLKATIAAGDVVVLMMNARDAELKILVELFETGAICHIDELFLRCSDNAECKNAMCGDCMSLFKSLRNSGIFVHQWWGD